jgi:signal transduction histidine kinase/CheY-like chemotaxis protein
MKIELIIAFLSGIAAASAFLFLVKRDEVEKEDKDAKGGSAEKKETPDAEIRLERAKEFAIKAELASEAKSRFIAYMTHEIRTSLNIIMGISQILQEDEKELGEKQKTFIFSISGASKKLLSVTDDAADFSTREKGERHFFIKQKSIDIRKMCSEIINEESAVAQSKGLEISLLLPDGIPAFVNGDRTKLSHLLYTLVENAIRFTEKGSVRLVLKNLDPASKTDTKIEFRIEDSGAGISEEKIKDIFDFTTDDVADSERSGNVKLGLAICKYLAENMGGSINVDSRKKSGTSFSIILPFKTAVEETAKKKESFAPASSRINNFSGKKALLAEDDPVNRQIEKILLQRYGFDVETASNGQDALEKYKSGKYDIIFMDCEMPVMNGFTSAREIRKVETETKQRTPIIAMTANAMTGDREMCLDAGMDDYVSKPVSIDKLIDATSKYLG